MKGVIIFLFLFFAQIIGIRNANIQCKINRAEISKGKGVPPIARPLPLRSAAGIRMIFQKKKTSIVGVYRVYVDYISTLWEHHLLYGTYPSCTANSLRRCCCGFSCDMASGTPAAAVSAVCASTTLVDTVVMWPDVVMVLMCAGAGLITPLPPDAPSSSSIALSLGTNHTVFSQTL